MNAKSWIRVHIYCMYIECVQNDQIISVKIPRTTHNIENKNQLYYSGVGVIAMFIAMTNIEIVILSIFCFLTSRISPNNSELFNYIFLLSNRIVT